MSECRFFPECARCNEIGDSWFPCEGGADGMRCADYAPMPDVDALMALADSLRIMDMFGQGNAEYGTIASKIRDALGVER